MRNTVIRTLTNLMLLPALLFSTGKAFATSLDALESYVHGVESYQSGEFDQSHQLLEAVSVDSSFGIVSLLEAQKLHYGLRQWDRFFAYSNFYRFRIHSLKNPKDFDAKFYALEAFALARHCRYEEAEQVLSEGLFMAQELGKNSDNLSLLNRAQNYLILLKNAYLKDRGDRVSSLNQTPRSLVFGSHTYWPVSARSQVLKKISHPKVLRMKVESRCE